MRRRAWIGGGLAAGMGLQGQLQGQEDPKARELLLSTMRALGGARFLGIRSRVDRGRVYTFYRSRLAGLAKAEIATKYEGGWNGGLVLPVRERISIPKIEDYFLIFDGKDRIEVTFRGARPLPLPQVYRFRENVTANILNVLRFRLGEKGLQLRYLGSDVVDNAPLEKLELYFASDARTFEVWVHRDTRLPVRSLYRWRNPKTRQMYTDVLTLGKFRDVQGVQWPLNIVRERDGDKEFELFADEVEMNVELADSLFQIPAGIPRLDRENEAF
jgi:hypothetical protein